jgi:hypothetical protein
MPPDVGDRLQAYVETFGKERGSLLGFVEHLLDKLGA